jgi:hypothetical protein
MAAGAGAAYFVVKKQLELLFEERLTNEIEATKNFYNTLHKRGEYETPQAAAEKLIPPNKVEELLSGTGEFANDPHAKETARVLTEYGGHKLDARTIVTETVVENVFIRAELDAQGVTDADWSAEVMNRTEEAPYVISKEEYMENESDYVQTTFDYYAGDGVLVDENENRIENIDDVVGDYNLIRFGAWSDDPRVVYVRNDARQLEVEITLNDGKYREIVQGLTE